MRSIADLPGFQALRADPKVELGIANVIRADDGVWALPLGRRLEKPSGEFAGLVGARGLVSYFQDFYRDIRVNPGTKVTLAAPQRSLARTLPAGGRLARQAVPGDRCDARGARRRRCRTVAHAQSRSTASSASPRCGPCPTIRWPSSSRATSSTALAEWRAQAIGTALRTLALSLLAALLLAIVARQLRRLDAAHESLGASRERFALAVAGSDDGIWDWNRDSDTIFASARARELYGLPPGPEKTPREEWHAQMRVHPDDVAPRLAAIEAHMAGKTPLYEFEYRVRHADGRYRWVRARGLCVRDADGEPLRMAGSVSDIDTRRRAEEERRCRGGAAAVGGALRDRDDRLRRGPLGLEREDRRVVLVAATAPADRYLDGEPPATRSEWRARVPMHPDDRERTQRAVDLHLAGLTPRLRVEYRIIDPASGEVRWIDSRGQCFRDADGRPDRVAGSTVDITERKRAEEALRESEERFARAVEGTNDGILDWDITNDRMFASERAMRIAGIDSGVVVRTHDEWLALLDIHPDDKPARETDVSPSAAGRP